MADGNVLIRLTLDTAVVERAIDEAIEKIRGAIVPVPDDAELVANSSPLCIVVKAKHVLTKDALASIERRFHEAIGPSCPPIVVLDRGMTFDVAANELKPVPWTHDPDAVRAAIKGALGDLRLALEKCEQTTHSSLRRGTISDVTETLGKAIADPTPYGTSELVQAIEKFLATGG